MIDPVGLRLDPKIAPRLLADQGLWRDVNDICDCGGRLAGTDSEKRAFALLRERVRAASPANAGQSIPVPYGGWRARRASLRLADGTEAACHPLVRTIATPPGGPDVTLTSGRAAGPVTAGRLCGLRSPACGSGTAGGAETRHGRTNRPVDAPAPGLLCGLTRIS